MRLLCFYFTLISDVFIQDIVVLKIHGIRNSFPYTEWVDVN